MDNAYRWSLLCTQLKSIWSGNRPIHMTVLNLTDIEFPITFKNISKFERLNMVSINVYGIENKQVLPLRFTDDKKEKQSPVSTRFTQRQPWPLCVYQESVKNASREFANY